MDFSFLMARCLPARRLTRCLPARRLGVVEQTLVAADLPQPKISSATPRGLGTTPWPSFLVVQDDVLQTLVAADLLQPKIWYAALICSAVSIMRSWWMPHNSAPSNTWSSAQRGSWTGLLVPHGALPSSASSDALPSSASSGRRRARRPPW